MPLLVDTLILHYHLLWMSEVQQFCVLEWYPQLLLILGGIALNLDLKNDCLDSGLYFGVLFLFRHKLKYSLNSLRVRLSGEFRLHPLYHPIIRRCINNIGKMASLSESTINLLEDTALLSFPNVFFLRLTFLSSTHVFNIPAIAVKFL